MHQQGGTARHSIQTPRAPACRGDRGGGGCGGCIPHEREGHNRRGALTWT